MFADQAIPRFLSRLSPGDSILDVGSGAGDQARIFRDNGYSVKTFSPRSKSADYGCFYGSFEDFVLDVVYPSGRWHETLDGCRSSSPLQWSFDGIWCSHVLEHAHNPVMFLEMLRICSRKVTAVTVPPLKHEVVGGHCNLYNAGILCYQMVLAGFDLSQASVGTYGYNISVISDPKTRQIEPLQNDAGDITRLKRFFPWTVDDGFDGRMPDVRW